uniref:Uncharacterized protein n=1 Tax=Steinernema glaseri TaxID=37863 RepID=A0A1I7Z566_9BILA
MNTNNFCELLTSTLPVTSRSMKATEFWNCIVNFWTVHRRHVGQEKVDNDDDSQAYGIIHTRIAISNDRQELLCRHVDETLRWLHSEI